jgi:hypothetical protein
MKEPTAVQLEDDVQPTASSEATSIGGMVPVVTGTVVGGGGPADGFGVRWTVHVCPFHSSATVFDGPSPQPPLPTAIHIDVDGHEMPSSCTPPGVDDFGVCSTVHLEPFQRSASVTIPGSVVLAFE